MIFGKQLATKSVVYGALLGGSLVLAAISTYAAASKIAAPQSYGFIGVGEGGVTAAPCESITCDTDDTCACLTGTDAVGVGNNLSFTISIDETNSTVATGGLRISNVGFCYPATGIASLANSKNKLAVSFSLSGLVCATTDSADVFSGTYVVTGGGGKLAEANGVGSINLSQTLPTGGCQVALAGSIQP
jgi:hypothetical protein